MYAENRDLLSQTTSDTQGNVVVKFGISWKMFRKQNNKKTRILNNVIFPDRTRLVSQKPHETTFQAFAVNEGKPMFADKNVKKTLLQQHLDDTQIQALDTPRRRTKHTHTQKKQHSLRFNQTRSLTMSKCKSEDMDDYVTQ